LRALAWIFGISVLVIAEEIPLYGYWRVVTQAHISIYTTDKKPNQPILNANFIIRDAADNVLAEAKSGQRGGIVRIKHPQYGTCEEEEIAAAASPDAQRRWDKCIGEMILWQARWADKVNAIDVLIGRCVFKIVPFELERSRNDWWLWWVPLPDVGGDPLTFYVGRVSINSENCQAATPRN
jgi:hypothetical protein